MNALDMKFSKVYPMLIQKAQKKGRTREEVLEVTSWLLGYSEEELEALLLSDKSYGEFLEEAPAVHPHADRITGSICGVRVEKIQDPLTRRMRELDKLVDELARGKSMEDIRR